MNEVLGLLVLLGVALVVLLALLTGVLVRGMRRPPRRTAGWAIANGLPVDPEDLGLAYDEWWLDRPDGARLPVWEIVLPGGADQDLTVVLVHGWGQSRIRMLERLDPWRELAGRIVAYDLRGHGDAEGSASRLGDREDDDLLALLERLGKGPVVLVGWSLGAAIAMRAATSDVDTLRQRIRSVVAYGPYEQFRTGLVGQLRERGHPVHPLVDLGLLALRVTGIRPLSPCEYVADVRCRLLIVHGRDDHIVPLAEAQRLAAAAPNATLQVVDDAAHADAHDVGGAALALIIRELVIAN